MGQKIWVVEICRKKLKTDQRSTDRLLPRRLIRISRGRRIISAFGVLQAGSNHSAFCSFCNNCSALVKGSGQLKSVKEHRRQTSDRPTGSCRAVLIRISCGCERSNIEFRDRKALEYWEGWADSSALTPNQTSPAVPPTPAKPRGCLDPLPFELLSEPSVGCLGLYGIQGVSCSGRLAPWLFLPLLFLAALLLRRLAQHAMPAACSF